MGNPLREPNAADKKVFAGLISSVYDQFVRAVVESRHLEDKQVRVLADGRVYTGEQALEKKLVDQLGSFQTAVDLAAEAAELKGRPELVYPQDDEESGLLMRLIKESTKTAVGELLHSAVGGAQPKYLLR